MSVADSHGSVVLRARNVHKRFGATPVLNGISLDVGRGEVLAIIGASGSGKTTFLRCINLLEEFQEGTIEIAGRLIGYEVTGGRRKRLSERVVSRQRADIGMVFQSFNLFPHMTAEQNVMLGLRKVRGQSAELARDTARRWLDRVGLAEKRGLYPYQLSGGQQQRVAIARAVAMEPQLLLLDEVTSALDPELVAEVLEVLRNLAQAGMTMIVVSHEIQFVRETATHVVFMDGGLVAEEGTPEAVLARGRSDRLTAFLRRFHGSTAGPG